MDDETLMSLTDWEANFALALTTEEFYAWVEDRKTR